MEQARGLEGPVTLCLPVASLELLCGVEVGENEAKDDDGGIDGSRAPLGRWKVLAAAGQYAVVAADVPHATVEKKRGEATREHYARTRDDVKLGLTDT